MGRYLFLTAVILLPQLASASVISDNICQGSCYGYGLSSGSEDRAYGFSYVGTSTVTFDTITMPEYLSGTLEDMRWIVWEGTTTDMSIVAISEPQTVVGSSTAQVNVTWTFAEPVTLSLSSSYVFTIRGCENDSCSYVFGGSDEGGSFWHMRPVVFDGEYNFLPSQTAWSGWDTLLGGNVGVRLEFSGYENGRIETWTPCAASSEDGETTTCGIETLPNYIRVTGVYDVEEAPWKLEVSIWDEDWNLLSSEAIAYETDLYGDFAFSFIGPSASSSYRVTACAVPIDGTSYFGAGTCARSMIGIGYATTTYNTYLENAGLAVFQSSSDSWTSLGCDELEITDVAKGMKCALIWAFRPSDTALNGLESLRDRVLHTWPLGYATLAYEQFASTTSATSSSVLDVDVDLKRFFGQSGATTTIDFGNITSGIEDFRPVLEPLEWILWGLWGLGIISWGLRIRL